LLYNRRGHRRTISEKTQTTDITRRALLQRNPQGQRKKKSIQEHAEEKSSAADESGRQG